MQQPSPGESKADQAQARPIASLATTFMAWAAIIFVCPVALLALYLLVPNTLELLERMLHYPVAPRLPLTLMLLVQVSLLILPTMTFLSWLDGRRGAKPRHRYFRTVPLAGATLGVGLFAYLWIGLMVAAFPD